MTHASTSSGWNTNVGRISCERGYSLVEIMISVAILTLVSGTVMTGVQQLTRVTETTSNRSEMHSGVRNATEFLQQEIGQAGRIAFPGAKALAGAVAIGAATVGVNSTPSSIGGATGLFVGELVTVGGGTVPASNCTVATPCSETVRIDAISTVSTPPTITATFAMNHAAGSTVTVQGGFGTGIVPPLALGFPSGSTGSLLKLYGDLSSDGRMQYVEYFCDTAGGNLYRNAMSFTAGAKPLPTVANILLNNIQANPDGTACFTYDTKPSTGGMYVVNVAVTLTVRTQDRDPITKRFETETKALLNVAPRNVFHVWQLAGQSNTSRLQPMPNSVTTLVAAVAGS